MGVAEVEAEGLDVLAVVPFRIPFNGVFSPDNFVLSLELEVLGLLSSLLVVGSGSGSSSTMLMGTRRRYGVAEGVGRTGTEMGVPRKVFAYNPPIY